jgi:hypothetical protein
VALALLAGCDAAGTAPADADVVSNEEAAVAVANAVAPEGGGAFEAVTAAADLRHGDGPHGGCTFERSFDPATTTWTRTVACRRGDPDRPAFARFGRTYTLRFYGADGTPQQDPATAASLDLALVDGYGERRTPALHHLLLDIGAALDVADLQEDLVLVNGTYHRSATDTVRVRGRGDRAGQRTLVYDLALTLSDVRVAGGPDGRRTRPVAGTVEGTIEGTATFTGPNGQTRTRDFSRAFTITFGGDGGPVADLRIGGDVFRVDLDAGVVMD